MGNTMMVQTVDLGTRFIRNVDRWRTSLATRGVRELTACHELAVAMG